MGKQPPGLGVVRRNADDLLIDIGGTLNVAVLERRIGVFPERDDRLLDGASFILEIRLERDRGVVESGVLKGLLG